MLGARPCPCPAAASAQRCCRAKEKTDLHNRATARLPHHNGPRNFFFFFL